MIYQLNYKRFFKFSTIFKGDDALDRYEKLNDDIFLQILYSTDPLLNESREILERIVKRNLYKHVSTLVLPLSDKEYSKKELEEDVKFLFYHNFFTMILYF